MSMQRALMPRGRADVPSSTGIWAWGGDRGADLRGSGRDVKDWASIGEWARDPGVRQDALALMEMASPMIGGFNAALGNPMGFSSGIQASPGAMPSVVEAAADPAGSVDAAAANAGGGEYGGLGGARDGGYADGGLVMPQDLDGPDPAGPDAGYAALAPGEIVLNPQQQQMMGPDAMRAMMQALLATGAKNVDPTAPIADTDFAGLFQARPDGGGPRGPGGQGFGVDPSMMAPMPTVTRDAADAMVITPESMAAMRRAVQQPRNRLFR